MYSYLLPYYSVFNLLGNFSTVHIVIDHADCYNWNRVKLRYCDGASFAGNSEFDNGALLSDCSAGGLAAFLHCDNFIAFLPSTTVVKCLSDAGFFLDMLGGISDLLAFR
ncbi:hypothetical protein Droror1_Dr00002157 [Drosera rotundifolia]